MTETLMNISSIKYLDVFSLCPLCLSRSRWNRRLQAEIKLFPPAHRWGRVVTWGHRRPRLFVPSCTPRRTSYAQAELRGGGGLGLAVQPAAEQWDAAQQYANQGTACVQMSMKKHHHHHLHLMHHKDSLMQVDVTFDAGYWDKLRHRNTNSPLVHYLWPQK